MEMNLRTYSKRLFFKTNKLSLEIVGIASLILIITTDLKRLNQNMVMLIKRQLEETSRMSKIKCRK